MSLHHHAGPVTVERLGTPDLVETFGYLDRDPVLNVYLLALTLRDGLALAHDEYWAARRDGALEGLLYLGTQSGAVLPHGESETALRALGAQARLRLEALPRRFQVIGTRPAVATLVEALAQPGLAPRLLRRQVYMALDGPGALASFERLEDLRPAAPEDFGLVYESGAQLRAEELEEDPRVADPGAYARRVEEECRDGYTWLWTHGARLLFRASVSAITADAVQISGVYTPPESRNRGLARRGLSELCVRLFDRSRAACLFVNDFNAPALAVYRRMGFRQISDWASAFFGGNAC